MAYYDVALLSSDADFTARVAAAYTTETLDNADAENPSQWAVEHSWAMAAQPGFGDAYASALAGGIEHPGADASVISDAQILGALQPMVGGVAA